MGVEESGGSRPGVEGLDFGEGDADDAPAFLYALAGLRHGVGEDVYADAEARGV